MFGNAVKCSCHPAQTAHRGPSAKQESQPDASNPTSAPTISSSPSGLKSKSTAKPDTSDGEDWGREQEEEEDEEEDEDDDEGDEDYEAPGGQSASGAGVSSHSSAVNEWTCPQCQTTFTDNEDYLSHVKMEHGKGPPLTRKRAATGGEGPGSSSEHDCEVGPPAGGAADEEESAAEDGGGPAKRTRASVASTSSAPSELEEEDSIFRCVPCGFSTEDGAEFQRHIPQHRGDTAAFQCLQCGVCFASAGSLSRHRFITHRVRDTQSDAERGAPRAPGSPSTSPGAASPLAHLEDGDGNLGCKVCGRRFDKATDLNTHFRTHGMAFLTAHKTDKPQ
ncbi:hypothetical protein XENOCAPTIV_021095 [Xenoophorus captivus]|uniref:C2H2-type domain-containing protein n=1 Tax=Xenoophorus captivus TaxID=1517983 RepID=A0ABV0RKF9_9TELE